MERIYALNAHASFACRHSGACCTAGWPIPVEPEKRTVIPVEWLTPDASGACPKFDGTTHLCRVHRDHGEEMLPESCRHFPRRALIDDRGTFLTLSHFCPTVSRLLVESREPLAMVPVVGRAASLTYEGLDARGEWPPLLRPGVLFDYDSFDIWLAYLVDTLGSTPAPAAALKQVAAVAERLRAWNVERGSLAEWTEDAVRRTVSAQELDVAWRVHDGISRVQRYERVIATVLADLQAPSVPAAVDSGGQHKSVRRDETVRELDATWNTDALPAGRYLAAKAFGGWTPYQSRDIRTQVAELLTAEAVVYVEAARVCAARRTPLDTDGWIEALRASDWLLMHLVDRDALMAWLNEATG